jgi:hypothetical protein
MLVEDGHLYNQLILHPEEESVEQKGQDLLTRY